MIRLLNVSISHLQHFLCSLWMLVTWFFLGFFFFLLNMQYILRSLTFSAWMSTSPACDDLHPTSSGDYKDLFPPLENAASAATGECASCPSPDSETAPSSIRLVPRTNNEHLQKGGACLRCNSFHCPWISHVLFVFMHHINVLQSQI